MEIPGLGPVTKDDELGWYYGEPMPVPVLDGEMCRIVIDGYDDDPNPEEFHAAIRNFLSADPRVLEEAEPHIYRYYQDCNAVWEPDDDEYLVIARPSDVWRHIQFGSEPTVTRRPYGDQRVYVSLECECDWEPEHGLQIVFKEGLRVNKVGSYDGHLTNSDAYGDPRLEDVIYRGT
ncbi:MAG TPA: hypothetical protein VFS20_33550 [Longimicrobium sp.]|nr:hypothetical protein [Longimicrobium sp.]